MKKAIFSAGVLAAVVVMSGTLNTAFAATSPGQSTATFTINVDQTGWKPNPSSQLNYKGSFGPTYNIALHTANLNVSSGKALTKIAGPFNFQNHLNPPNFHGWVYQVAVSGAATDQNLAFISGQTIQCTGNPSVSASIASVSQNKIGFWLNDGTQIKTTAGINQNAQISIKVTPYNTNTALVALQSCSFNQ